MEMKFQRKMIGNTSRDKECSNSAAARMIMEGIQRLREEDIMEEV